MRLIWLALPLLAGLAVGEVCTTDTCPAGANPKGSMLLQSKQSKAVGSPVDEEEEDMEEPLDPAVPEERAAEPLVPPEVVRQIVVDRQRTPRPLLEEETTESEAWVDMRAFDSSASTEATGKKKMHDGDLATFGGAVEFVIDMGETYQFSKTRGTFRVCKCTTPGSVLFALSMEKKNWYTYLTPTFWDFGEKLTRTWNHHTLRGRYLKVWVTELAELQYLQLWDFTIYGKRDPQSHPNVYGWWHSYRTGVINGLGGTEIMHITPYKDKLFAGTGYWNNPTFRAAEVVRLDCPYCDWVIESVIFPMALRTEVLNSVRWTTDKDGGLLPQPVDKLITGFFVRNGNNNGDCYASVRDDATGAWHLELFLSRPWENDRFSVRALQMHKDSVTGVDMLFIIGGRDGVVSGTWRDARDSKVQFAAAPEGGPVDARPLAITVMDTSLYFSSASQIKRRLDGTHPSWEVVWEHLNVDDVTVDESVGGIRGLTSIEHNGGRSLFFNWAPNGQSSACMIRLDPTTDGGFQHTQEACIRDLAKDYLGNNIDGLGAKVPYGLADYNWALELPTADGGSVHIIGFQIILFSYSTSDFPTDPAQTYQSASGKPIGFYAGAGYAIRRGPDNYEIREPGGKRYDPAHIYPKLVAVRALARSPWPNDKAAYMGGYDTNFFEAENTGWVMRAPYDTIFEQPVPCQPELGCGHTPGMTFQTYGCDWCSFREFAGFKLIGFQDGRAVNCQDNMDFLNSDAGAQYCEGARLWPSEVTCCLGNRCNICRWRRGKMFEAGKIAGYREDNSPYTCKDVQDMADSGGTTCKQARKTYSRTCCI